jgi:putative phosphoesterase
VPNVKKAIALFAAEGVEAVIHAGDFVAPFAIPPLGELRCRVVAVLGNNDGEKVGLQRRFEAIGGTLEPKMATLTVGGRRIAVVHEPEPVEALAASGLFDLVVYGHTHQIDVRSGACLILNPGETGGWTTGRATVAIVDLATMAAEIRDIG